MAPQHVRIRLLGGFDVQVDGATVPAGVWRLNKARSLLKLLALAEGNRLPRDAVVEALWPQLGAVAGTNNLHQALHAAHRALVVAGASAGVLRLRDGVVALCPDGGLETDVQDLEEALLKALASDDPDRLLDVAVRCAAGLLPEDSYEDWLRPQQERVAGMHRTAVLASANGLIAQGRANEASTALKSVADARPTDEEVHTPFAHRRSPFLLNCVVRTQNTAELPPMAEWAQQTREETERFGQGPYVNFTGEGGAERAAYPPQTYARLADVKRRYDPNNVFSFNQNISPTAED
jgi:DNA-binding SARP family transcriptional activator